MSEHVSVIKVTDKCGRSKLRREANWFSGFGSRRAFYHFTLPRLLRNGLPHL
jgi:hypothetical protein